MLDSFLFSGYLEDDETVTMIAHKHWAIGFRGLILPSLSFVASLTMLSRASTQTLLYVTLLWVGLSVIWWSRNFLDYYLDAWLITNHGVIDLEWHGWFHRQSSRVLYSDVQGVSYEIQGLTATLCRYGTISVEKISTGSAISLSHVPRPRAVEACILKNMETYLYSKNMKDSKHVQEILASIVAERVQLDEFSPRPDRSEPAPEKKAPSKKRSFQSTKIGSRSV